MLLTGSREGTLRLLLESFKAFLISAVPLCLGESTDDAYTL